MPNGGLYGDMGPRLPGEGSPDITIRNAQEIIGMFESETDCRAPEVCKGPWQRPTAETCGRCRGIWLAKRRLEQLEKNHD